MEKKKKTEKSAFTLALEWRLCRPHSVWYAREREKKLSPIETRNAVGMHFLGGPGAVSLYFEEQSSSAVIIVVEVHIKVLLHIILLAWLG